MEKKFEVALRKKMRFPYKGIISVEDLWDLSPKELDSIFKTLNAQAKQEKEESLLETKNQQIQEADIKIEIIRYIVDVKLKEAEARVEDKVKKEKREKIKKILDEKRDEEMLRKNPEELEKMLEELE